MSLRRSAINSLCGFALQVPDLSSSDRILVAGFVIVVIVLFSVLFRWQREKQDEPIPAVDYDKILPKPS